MPRLEDGEFAASASKFKKRRAWIMPDDPVPMIEATNYGSQASAKQNVENTLIGTKLEHEYNKSITRLEHECNKTVTRVEQKIPRKTGAKQTKPLKVEHEYNKSITRLEHEYNKTVTDFEIDNLFAFINTQRIQILNFEDELQCLILNLSDVQKRVFWHVALECINRNSPRTRPMEIKSFFDKLDISTPVIRTTLNRLVDKRLIQREKGKLGKNGFAIISLSKVMFDAVSGIFAEFESKHNLDRI